MSIIQITHLDQRSGNVCCLSVLAPGGKKEQAEKLCVCGGMWGRDREWGSTGSVCSSSVETALLAAKFWATHLGCGDRSPLCPNRTAPTAESLLRLLQHWRDHS